MPVQNPPPKPPRLFRLAAAALNEQPDTPSAASTHHRPTGVRLQEREADEWGGKKLHDVGNCLAAPLNIATIAAGTKTCTSRACGARSPCAAHRCRKWMAASRVSSGRYGVSWPPAWGRHPPDTESASGHANTIPCPAIPLASGSWVSASGLESTGSLMSSPAAGQKALLRGVVTTREIGTKCAA